uniref:Reverse transcriptase domain-containing protein n=1 Tax=Glossina palpalis gambiensis TaxID=67801 RepID=A0A1B0BCG4_9MUSC
MEMQAKFVRYVAQNLSETNRSLGADIGEDKQADRLSSILLNIVMDELICHPQHAEVGMRSTVVRCLVYADDPFLFARTNEHADHMFLYVASFR